MINTSVQCQDTKIKMANKFADPNDPVQYPGLMSTYPGMVRGQPPIYVHDCVPGCPGMPKRPLVPIAGGPAAAKAVNALMGKPGGGLMGMKPKVPKKVVSHCTPGKWQKMYFQDLDPYDDCTHTQYPSSILHD